jgi:hypothetical protein
MNRLKANAQVQDDIENIKPATGAVFSVKTLQQACAQNNPSLARIELLNWIRQQYGSQADFTSIRRHTSKELADACADLDACQFSAAPRQWNGKILWKAMQTELKQTGYKDKSADTLPPLN